MGCKLSLADRLSTIVMVKQVCTIGMTLLEFVLFSNGYIALCAVVMCQMTAALFYRVLPPFWLPFLFMATLSSYALHWYLTPITTNTTERNQWNRRHKSLLLSIGIGSGVVGLALLTQLSPYLVYLIPVMVATLLYTAPKLNYRPFRYLRRIAILKTAYLALVWTFVTAILPLLITAPVWNTTLTVWAFNRFLFIYSICFWFDYRDRDEDKETRWLTLVSGMNQHRAVRVFYGIVCCFILSEVWLLGQGMGLGIVGCLGIPMMILTVSIQYISAWKSDYWYYLYLDGLLMLTGLLLLWLE